MTVSIPLLPSFQKWRRKHHHNLELIVSARPPTGQTGKLQLPRGQSVTSKVPDQTELAATMIAALDLQARENRYREIPTQRQLLPTGQPQFVKAPAPAPAMKAAIQNSERPNWTLKNLEKLDSEPPASPADKVTELLMIVTPPLLPAGQ